VTVAEITRALFNEYRHVYRPETWSTTGQSNIYEVFIDQTMRFCLVRLQFDSPARFINVMLSWMNAKGNVIVQDIVGIFRAPAMPCSGNESCSSDQRYGGPE
jgi:hypothetical protein